MFITRKRLARRTLLRGLAGGAIGLPFLTAMVPAISAPPPAQLRFGAVYVPNGIRPEIWTPTQGLKNQELQLSPLMEPLQAHREQINVISNLRASTQSEHHSATSLWLHGGFVRKTEGADVRSATTIDQHIAKLIGQKTALPSLEIGIEDMSGSPGSCAYGYSCMYMNTLSWRTPTQPLPMELNPQVVFERLFGDSGSLEQRTAKWRDKRSIIDSVLTATHSLNSQLGVADRSTMDEYLNNIREVERRISLAGKQLDSNIPLPKAPTGIPIDYDDYVKIMYELVTLAWRSDATRVFSFMKGVEASPINYPQLGVPESHHIISHHENKPEKQDKYKRINAYHLSLFAEFLDNLATTNDGDGSLLEHSLIMYGSSMGNGNRHDQTKLPVLLAGTAAGLIKGGRHIETPPETPMANLIKGIGDVVGITIENNENNTGTVTL